MTARSAGARTRDDLVGLAAWDLEEEAFLSAMGSICGRPIQWMGRRGALPTRGEDARLDELFDRFGQVALATSSLTGDGTLCIPGNAWRDLRFLLEEGWLAGDPPAHAGLPVHIVPGWMRLKLYGLAAPGGLLRSAPDPSQGSPGWPIEDRPDSFRLELRRALKRYDIDSHGELPAASRVPESTGPWPGGKRFALVISHDVDTRHGLAGARRQLDAEVGLGLKPTFYFVGKHYRWDEGLCRAILDAGGEVGLHGVHHDNRLAWLAPQKMRARLDSCRDLIEKWDIQGFRSPSLLLTQDLMTALGPRFAYDSSTIDTDIDTLMGPRRGCSTIFPHRRHGMIELPITLPADDRLLLRGLRGLSLLEQLRSKAHHVADRGGLVMILNHSEPHLAGGRTLHDLYRSLLTDLLDRGDAWVATASEVERFWRTIERDARSLADQPIRASA